MTQKRHAATRSFAGPCERAAEKPGFTGDAALAYARDVVAADFKEAGDGDTVRTVLADLRAKDVVITEQAIRAKVNELGAQVKAKRKDKNFAEWAHVQSNGFRRRSRFPLLRLCASCASRPAAGPHPAGLLLILGGLLFLPILGIWMLPLGLLLLAEDLPVLRSCRSRILDLIERHLHSGWSRVMTGHDARRDPKTLHSKLGSNDFSAAPISVKSGLFETLQHVVVRCLRIELRGEPLSV
jgi:hypothetical protein